jgi:uncharacterized membrane-anchored protein
LKPVHKALLLGIVQLALVASLGGKLLADRATRPRFWLKAAPVDPDLPIRGRYVRLQVEVPATGLGGRFEKEEEQRMSVRQEPLVYFIPEHAPDPSRRAADEELWVEVTLPKKGPLRPIRLGVKKGGVLTPLPI